MLFKIALAAVTAMLSTAHAQSFINSRPTIVFSGSGCGSGLPVRVSNLKAIPGDEQVQLTWDRPTSGGCVSQFKITALPVAGSGRTAIAASSPILLYTPDYTLVVKGLTNGVKYRFEVVAINDKGASSFASVEATPIRPVDTSAGLFCLPLPPQAPVNLQATPLTTESVRVCFQGPRTCVDQYEITAEPLDTIARFGLLDKLFRAEGGCLEIKGLTSGVRYRFTVTSTSNLYGSGGSAYVDASPLPRPTTYNSGSGVAVNVDLGNWWNAFSSLLSSTGSASSASVGTGAVAGFSAEDEEDVAGGFFPEIRGRVDQA